MSWKRLVGLDFLDTAVHVLATIILAVAVSELTGVSQLGPAVLGLSVIVYGIRRRKAMVAPEQLAPPGGEGQARINDYFEMRIAELEERLEFAERLLASEAGRASPGR